MFNLPLDLFFQEYSSGIMFRFTLPEFSSSPLGTLLVQYWRECYLSLINMANFSFVFSY